MFDWDGDVFVMIGLYWKRDRCIYLKENINVYERKSKKIFCNDNIFLEIMIS